MVADIISVLSIIVVILIGYISGKRNIISSDMSSELSKIVMLITFPFALFVSTAKSDIHNLVNVSFFGAFFFGLMGLYLLILLFCLWVLKKDRKTSGIIALSISFPNMAFMGIPYLSQTLGGDSLIAIAIGNVITSVFMIPITVALVEGEHAQTSFGGQLINVLKKPLVFAPIIGIIFSALHIELPQFVSNGFSLIGSATSPIALFALGLMMTKFKFRFSQGSVSGIILKLLVQPVIAIAFVVIFSLHGLQAQEIVILVAMPSAVIVGMFTEKYNTYQDEAVSMILGAVWSLSLLWCCLPSSQPICNRLLG
ncbi:AEC family transporter [Dongshaea marina]|uniref:AEC family transporter n=1 Tax=Dongshaea marina TaxID=2047966 RepID=UPI000D3E4D05|nr:AEC family transporter [Dongshaea marina]